MTAQQSLLAFFADRLKVHLREQGARHDLVDAVFALGGDDLLMIVRRVEALGRFLDTEDGEHLLTGTKRAINILRIEEKKDGRSYDQPPDPNLLKRPEEKALAKAVDEVEQDSCRGHRQARTSRLPWRRWRSSARRSMPSSITSRSTPQDAELAREPPAPAEPHPRHDPDRRRFLQDRRLRSRHGAEWQASRGEANQTGGFMPKLQQSSEIRTITSSSYGTLALRERRTPWRGVCAPGRGMIGKGSVPGLLYDLGAYPGAVFEPTNKARIVGDVFELKPDGRLLAELDAL